MNRIESALRSVAVDLSELEVPWAVVGGFAVSARTEPRFTRDIDVAVTVADDEGAESVVRRLGTRGYRVVMLSEQDAVGGLATARLVPPGPGEDIVVDILFASSGIEPEIVAGATQMELIAGLVVPVALVGHLIAMKLLARDDDTRPQDRSDLVALRASATVADLRLAEQTIDLIDARGFGRGRDLRAALLELIKAGV